MSQCPNCSAEVEEGFGLTQCLNCGSMLVFDFEGRLKVSEEEGSEVSQEQNFEDQVAGFTSQSEESSENQVEVPFEDVSFEVEPETTEDVQEVVAAETFEPEITKDVQVEGAEELFKSEASVDPASLESVQEFANSDLSDAPDGEYLYHLKISNIDDSDTRQTLWEILSEQRLRLDMEAIKRQFKNGVLEISKLSPIKAHYIVAQLRQLPVEVSWKQMTIYQGELG